MSVSLPQSYRTLRNVVFVMALLGANSLALAEELQEATVRFSGIEYFSQAELAEQAGVSLFDSVSEVTAQRIEDTLGQKAIYRSIRCVVKERHVDCVLRPRRNVFDVSATGAREFSIDEIRRTARIRIGSDVDQLDTEDMILRIQQKYEENGFRNPKIRVEVKNSTYEFFSTVIFHIEEGYQSKIAAVDVSGSFPEDLQDIPTRLRDDAEGLEASKRNFEELRRNLLLAIRREGYLQATVQAPSKRVVPSTAEGSREGDRDYILQFEVRTGTPLSIVFVGNEALSAEELLAPLRMESRTVPFTPGAVASLTRQIAELYHERGFFDASASWTELPPQGDRKIFRIRLIEGPRYHASTVQISGNRAFSDAEIKRIISTKEAGWWFLRRWEPGIVLPTQLEIDRGEIEKAYFERGYYDVAIKTDVLRDEEDSSLEVQFLIEEGPQRLITDVELEWQDALAQSTPLGLLEIEPQVHVGEPFNRVLLREEQHRLYTIIQQFGYPNASVELQGNAIEGSVRYRIELGSRVLIDDIFFQGAIFTKEFVLRKELQFSSGDAWNGIRVSQSQRRIAQLGLFREVDIRPLDGVLDGPIEDVVVEIQERPTGNFEIGAAFTSEDGLHVFGDLSQRNFLGQAHKLRLGVDSYIKPDSSKPEAGSIRLAYTIPSVMETDNDLLSEVFFQSNSQLIDEYSYDRYGAWVSLHRALSERVKVIVGVSGFRDSLYDVDPEVVLGERDTTSTNYVLPGLALDVDARDNSLAPTKGYRSYFDIKWASEDLFSDVNFVYGGWRQSHLLPLGSRFTWANRLQLEAFEPYGDTEVIPLSQRLFLGGQNSLRGFSKHAVGPRSSDGVVVGGDRAMSASTELRYAFTPSVTGLIFLDVGQAFLVHRGTFDGEENEYDQLRYSPGFGAHYNTPIGPIRAEFGFALDREFGERTGRINISIGTAY